MDIAFKAKKWGKSIEKATGRLKNFLKNREDRVDREDSISSYVDGRMNDLNTDASPYTSLTNSLTVDNLKHDNGMSLEFK